MSEPSIESPPKIYALVFWISGLSLAPLLFIFDIMQLSGLRLTRSRLMVGRDFFNVWTGGNLASSGNQTIIYDYHKYMAWQHQLFGPLDPYNYSYPPHSLFLAIPFAQVPYIWALLLWTVLGAAFFYWSARSFIPKNMPPILAVLTPAAMVNIWCGHYGFLIGGLWLFLFSSIASYPVRSGIIASLLTLKPHLGLLVAAVLAYRRMLVTIAVAIFATLLLVGLSGLFFGFDLWTQWIFGTSALQAKIMTAPGPKFYYYMMPSTFIALRTAPREIAVAAQICMGVVALFLCWKARDARPHDLAFISASATALISPYIFNYDLTVASLGFAVFTFNRWGMLKAWERLSLWLAFASPLLVMAAGFIAPPALLAGLVVQVRHANKTRDVKEPSGFALMRKKRGGAVVAD
jgi:hypothetical protein